MVYFINKLHEHVHDFILSDHSESGGNFAVIIPF